MVSNVKRKFNFPLKEHYWVKNLCVDVNNIASSNKLYCRSPLEVGEGFTQDIKKFSFRIWEPI